VRRPARHRPPPVAEVLVESLGAGGDGLASTPAGRVFVPFTLPGERWRVRPERPVEGGWLATPLERLDGPERAEPVCPHFGTCGGCRLQHLPADAYAAFKRDRVRAALARRGLGDAPVEEVRTALPRSRRRLRLALAREGGGLRLGFRQRGSRAVVPVASCPIARPELETLLAPLAAGLVPVLAPSYPAELSLTLAENGVDVLLHADRTPSLPEREGLAALADQLDLARVAWGAGEGPPEPIAERRAPFVRLADVPVVLPPGAFLQATTYAEAELAAAVRDWSAGARSAADLYAGLGTLGLPLAAAGARVHAVELAGEPLRALQAAANARHLPLTTEVRDLVRRPLAGPELDRFDLVLLDPPRAGALAQAQALAQSRVPRVLYAACDPGTFARDARVLTDAGFRLRQVRPIDQFLYSPEVELIARLERDVAPALP